MASSGQEVTLPPNENEGPTILAATVTMTILASVLSLAPRLYVRIRMMRNIGWDDYTMCLAAILSLVAMIIVILEVQHGAGRHWQYIDPEDMKIGIYLNFLTQPIYVFVSLFVKESVGFFLLRIAGKGRYRMMIISIMVGLAVYTFAGFLTIMLQCKDLRTLWDPNVRSECWSVTTLQALSYLNSVVTITTDFAFAILIPVPLLYRLQMNNRKKGSLIAILGMGIFACSAGIVRTLYLRNYGKQGDFLWDSRNITIWVATETQIGILAGNLPAMKPLFRRILETTGSWSRTAKDHVGQRYGHSHFKGSSGGHVEEIDLGLYGSNGVESDTVAMVHTRDSVCGGSASGLSIESTSQLGRGDGSVGSFPVPESGIMRTTDVKINYDVRKSLGR
ncbi:putative integral membrane family protein [Neofusicoccum parvum]|uniref:Integral membrane family protein n=1 Tax=Neofusicoccum parvum TaxID=310453 RepID=A0ACB5S9Q4_9PEZI|nr:putative integral membrane family protein [Neofusicoccum parvum]GME49377.1 putative integral membrane family protein [Neofusicoccum parvum]